MNLRTTRCVRVFRTFPPQHYQSRAFLCSSRASVHSTIYIQYTCDGSAFYRIKSPIMALVICYTKFS